MNTCCLCSLDQYLGKKFAVKLFSSFPMYTVRFCTLLSLLRSPVRTLEGSYSSFCLEGYAAAHQWQTCLPEKRECAEQSTAHNQQHTEIQACRQETPVAAYSFEDLLTQTPNLTQKQKSCQGSKSLLSVGTTAGREGSIQLSSEPQTTKQQMLC